MALKNPRLAEAEVLTLKSNSALASNHRYIPYHFQWVATPFWTIYIEKQYKS
jgi:hypothetical protein